MNRICNNCKYCRHKQYPISISLFECTHKTREREPIISYVTGRVIGYQKNTEDELCGNKNHDSKYPLCRQYNSEGQCELYIDAIKKADVIKSDSLFDKIKKYLSQF